MNILMQARTCKDNEFKCKNRSGRCILKFNVCNGKQDCGDGSDEDTSMCKVRVYFKQSIF